MNNECVKYRISAYFDGARFQQGDFLLSISAGKIDSLAPWNSAFETADECRDLRGYALTPPLADAHIHAALAPWPLAPAERKGYVEADPYAKALARLEKAAHSGLNLLRDGGDPSGINLRVRTALQEASALGQAVPHYLVPGPALHSPGRYGSFIGAAIAGRDEMRQMAARLRKQRVDFIKVLPTGIINFNTGLANSPLQFDTEDLRYFIDLCHGEGWRVMAHASGAAGVRQAAICGADFIEHGYFVEPDTLELMADKGIAWTPTLAPVWIQMHYHQICGWDAAVRDRLANILAGHRSALARAMELGVPILTGSDAGAPGVDQTGGVYLELALLQETGVAVEQLLRWSCVTTPELLGVSIKWWETGAPARFIIAPKQVVNDITALLRAPSVVWDGVELAYHRPHVFAEDILSVA